MIQPTCFAIRMAFPCQTKYRESGLQLQMKKATKSLNWRDHTTGVLEDLNCFLALFYISVAPIETPPMPLQSPNESFQTMGKEGSVTYIQQSSTTASPFRSHKDFLKKDEPL